MIDAINRLNGMYNNIDMHNKDVMKPYIATCEVFYVHLCEAARMYVIESLISRTLEHNSIEAFENPTYVQEANHFLEGEGGRISEGNDVYSLVKGSGPFNSNLSKPTPANIGNFIHSYKQMCKAWFTYSLTGKKFFMMDAKLVSKLNMRSIKSLRCSLGVLGNTNLDKILDECMRKKARDPSIITAEELRGMEERILGLYEQKKVINYKLQKEKKQKEKVLDY